MNMVDCWGDIFDVLVVFFEVLVAFAVKIGKKCFEVFLVLLLNLKLLLLEHLIQRSKLVFFCHIYHDFAFALFNVLI